MTPHFGTATAAIGVLLAAVFSQTLHAQVVRWRDAKGREVERHCQPAEWPKNLPALDSVLDGAALYAAVDARSGSQTTTLLVSILYREDATPIVRLLEADSLLFAEGALLLELVARGLRPLSPDRPLAAIRLRVQGGLDRTATIERSVYCPPEPAPGGRRGPQRVEVEVSPGERVPTSGRVRMDAELSIDETGRVSDVRLTTRSGVSELDDHFVRTQYERAFFPALIDNLPIASWARTTGPRMRL